MSVQIETIKDLAFLRNLPEEVVVEFAESCVPRSFGRNEIIYSPGDENERVFLLLSGEAKLYQSSGGRKAVIQVFKAGDFFGDLSFASPSSFKGENFVQTQKSSRVCVILNQDLMALIKKFPQFAMLLLVTLRDRLHYAESRIRDLAVASAQTRLMNELIRYAVSRGKEVEGFYQIEERLTHQDLAEMTGLTRETVTKTLKLLKKQGFISHAQDRLFKLNNKKIIKDCLECIKYAGGA